MQHDPVLPPGATLITPTAPIRIAAHGARAKCLQRLIRLGLPVPRTVALDAATVAMLAEGGTIDTRAVLAAFGPDTLVSIRPSSGQHEWGGPASVLNAGMNDARHAVLSGRIGADKALRLHARFIRSYAMVVAGVDCGGADDIPAMLAAFEAAHGRPFPQDPAVQLADVLRGMAAAWNAPTARLLRAARGAPDDAALGLVVQQMVLGVGDPALGEDGAGVIQFVDGETGRPRIVGRYLSQSQGRDALQGQGALYLTSDPRGPALQDVYPQVFMDLQHYGTLCRTRLREEMQIEFTLQDGALYVLDAVGVQRSTRAALRIAVTLATDGIIPEAEAVSRVQPRALLNVLHRRIRPGAGGAEIGRGIAASPGAATGALVLTAADAHAAGARGEACILVRSETVPEDVLGMHAAAGILTVRGGVSSHAAVIARGLGLPCVVGAAGLSLDAGQGLMVASDGRVLHSGQTVTLDGHGGRVIAGAVPLVEPMLDDAFATLLSWADEVRDIGVRANCDTPSEAQTAARFGAEGIGLCRTEHMFFEPDRLAVMREMIFAEDPQDRARALARLLPVQRADFTELFAIMAGRPVCIRLLDPPLHEFLPSDADGIAAMAAALHIAPDAARRRAAALAEANPMLGMRGVRLGIAIPEIYDMQARAIFEAAAAQGDVVPEVMIPLVSARREVDLVAARIAAVARSVRDEMGVPLEYRLGVMVETPRAALRADEIAEAASFLSFGTNDLTQMTYGLSRDDAGRFLSSYVAQGVFADDPFLRLDMDGVGELLRIGAERGRRARPDVTLSICGEHGGDPDSIDFSRAAGFDYVSCSPFRVPVARLAAAHLAIRDRGGSLTAPPER
ncbi:pyruvate, phosphate dikinase [Oceaniovalibus guishaninsula JLT2003]|uniref:Pyruvate, phosphate dikinase n=1 Tax=Oceaniovalibus guishaninsula JLT2003 TaxID=1231392 RepID=K2HDY9_9RHOB|nr:putative PEP-binding protein [Oceaniovalibus guishaninsula]EKE44752.1 pyruvate, phosphate dikinase [Oceaniovalibus guishaninsula JLT2003]